MSKSKITESTRKQTLAQLIDGQPPCDVSAEMACVGAAILQGAAIMHIDAVLAAEDFYDPANAVIYSALRQLILDGHETTDIALLATRLRASGALENIGGVAYLNRLALACSNYANAPYYAAIVAEKAKRRRLLAAAIDIANDAMGTEGIDDVVARATTRLKSVDRERPADAESFHDVSRRLVKTLRERQSSGSAGPAVFCGLPRIDQVTGGFAPGDLVVLGARTGCGKTTFALHAAMHNGDSGRHVLFVSLEMKSTELIARRLGGEAGVDANVIRGGQCTRADIESIEAAAAQHQHSMLTLWSPQSATVERIASTARICHAASPLSMVVVDYITFISPPDRRKQRYEQVDDIVKGLKAMARELDCPVLALSQLNRDAGNDEPDLKHLRESGAVEQDADTVMLLHSPKESDSDRLDVIIAKHRFGQRCKLSIRWDRAAGLFSDDPLEFSANDW